MFFGGGSQIVWRVVMSGFVVLCFGGCAATARMKNRKADQMEVESRKKFLLFIFRWFIIADFAVEK